MFKLIDKVVDKICDLFLKDSLYKTVDQRSRCNAIPIIDPDSIQIPINPPNPFKSLKLSPSRESLSFLNYVISDSDTESDSDTQYKSRELSDEEYLIV